MMPLKIPEQWRRKLSAEECTWAEWAAKRLMYARSPASMASCLDPNFVVHRHIDLIDRHLVALFRGDIDRLLVIMPPRHGKTLLSSTWFPAWCLYKEPEEPVALASYGDDYSRGINRDTKGIISRYPELELKLSPDSRSNARWNLTPYKGSMRAVGVGGQLTGSGAHRLLLDDVVKDWAEAQSPTVREATWDWYSSTARTRLQGIVPTISMVCTLWHADDLGSRLRASGDFHVLHLRALANADETLADVSTVDPKYLLRWPSDQPATWERKEGEAVCEAMYSADYLRRTRDEVGPNVFNALYQGDPTPVGGNLFGPVPRWSVATFADGDRMMLGTKPVDLRRCWTFATVDLAITVKTSADFTVAGVFAVTPDNDLVLIDGVRDRIRAEDHGTRILPLVQRHNCRFVGVETSLHTSRLVQDLARAGMPIRELRPDKDKVTRSLPATVRVSNHTLWMPDRVAYDPWAAELLAFPNGSHDDVVDMVAWAAMVVPTTPTRRKEADLYARDDRSPQARLWRTEHSGSRRRPRHPELGRL